MKTELKGLSMKERERMAIELRRSGKTEEEIAQELDCSPRTVRRYLYDGLEYESQESNETTVRQIGYTIEEGFDWKWPMTCNLILSACGKKTQPVPAHSKAAEEKYWTLGQKRATRYY